MRILLTGTSGYIGRFLLGALAESHEVIRVVRDAAQRTDAAESIVWDFSAPAVPALPARIDAIVHAAQSRRYRDFPEGAINAFQVNVASTALLADYACRAKAQCFCLLSSGSVYEPYRGRLRESSALAPTSINGATKLAAERVLAPYAQAMSIAALRLFFPYGPGQSERLIPDLIERVRKGSPITVAGRAGLVMTPVYVDDVARIVRRAVENAWRGPINVAGATPITLRRVVEDIGRSVGAKPNLRHTTAKPPRVVPDISRLRELMDVSTMVNWETGLSRVLACAQGPSEAEPSPHV